MKICVVSGIFPPDIGGPATYVYEILNRLSERGHEVKVITFSDSAQANTNVYRIKNRHTLRNNLILMFFAFIYTYLDFFLHILKHSKNFDVIYLQNPSIQGFISLLAAKLRKKPIVLKFVGDVSWEAASNRRETSKCLEDFLKSPEGGLYTRILYLSQKLVFKHVDKIVVASQYSKGILTQYYKVEPNKIEIIYNTTDLIKYKLKEGKRYGYPTIITIGRLVPWKEIPELLKVTSQLVRKYPNIKLLIVGDGPERENLEDFSIKLNINNHVMFTGNVSHEKVIKFLNSSDLFVLNSSWESFSFVLIEAMACKIPIVTTNIRGTSEVINNRTGLLVEQGNEKDLLDKIIYALENKEETTKLVENAYGNVKNKFTWDKTLKKLELLLEGVII